MKSVLLLAYQLHPYKGSEYAVAWDYITEMSKSNRLTVMYGSSGGFHEIGNTSEMEQYCKQHPLANVTFIPVLPSGIVNSSYGYSAIGTFLFYREYRKYQREIYQFALKLVKEQHFDVVHYLGPIGYREPGYLWKLPLPYIWGPIGGFSNVNLKLMKATQSWGGKGKLLVYRWYNLFQQKFSYRVRKALRAADVVLCCTTQTKRIVDKIKCESDRVVYLPENGIKRLYDLNEEKFRNKMIRLIWVGSIDSRKALIFLLEALAKVDREAPVRVDIVGEGILEEKMKQYAERHHISHFINWHGKVEREKVFSLMNNAHLHVITSLNEANTTVVWEAMSMGVPTMSLDHCGMHDTICSECGILVQPNSYAQVVNDMAENIRMLVADPSRLWDMARGVCECRKKYIWDVRSEVFEQIYNLAISNYENSANQ